MQNINHVIYLMLENRSFDSVLGWMYDGQQPSRFLPLGTPTVFRGMDPSYYNPDSQGSKHYVTKIPDGDLSIPTKDPNEAYEFVNNQLFGSKKNPPVNTRPNMMGFYKDYAGNNSDTKQIMAGYTYTGLGVLNGLAKLYACSDAYYSSVPTQTNCNRAFAATGSSIGVLNGKVTGMVDNHWGGSMPWDPFQFIQPTMWNVLQNNGYNTPNDWTIYYSQLWPGHELGDYCYTQDLLWPSLKNYGDHFKDISEFFNRMAAGSLPKFSYLEPAWFEEEWGIGFNGNDYHPPANLQPGEAFLLKLFRALLQSPAWNNTLLIINFDEHGGTYDHQAPPWGAAAPWANPADGTPAPQTTELDFQFNRFGVRVPLILVSPRVSNSTIFRSNTNVPFDHTSVIATILKHFNIPKSRWGMGSRVANAPTFEFAVNQARARTDKPKLEMEVKLSTRPEPVPPNDLQLMIIHRAMSRAVQRTGYPKKQFRDLYNKHYKNIKTTTQMKTAVNKIMKQVNKYKPGTR